MTERGMTEAATKPTRLVHGFLSLSGAEVISKVLNLVTFAFIARITGPSGFGYLEFASSVVLCSGFLVDQGFGVYGARAIAQAPSSTARLVTEVTSLRLVLALVVYSGLLVFMYVLDRPPAVKQLILLYGVTLLLMPFMLQWVFQGHDRMRVVAAMQIVRATVFAVTVFAVLRESEDLWAVATAEVCSVAVVVGVVNWLYRSRIRTSPGPGFRLSSRVFLGGSTIGLGQMFWSVRMYGATVVMGLIATEIDVGYFSAAIRLAIGLNAFVWLYFVNLMPSMSRMWAQDRVAFQRLMGRAIRTAGWLALGGGMLWVLLAPKVIQLAYGGSFMPATAPLQWMSALSILGAIHGNFRFGLIAADHQRYATTSAGLGTLVALVLIPVGYTQWGVSGAAGALVAGEVVVWVTSFLFSRRMLGLERPLLQIVRPALAGAVLCPLLWTLPEAMPEVARAGIATLGVGLALWAVEGGFRAAVARRLRK